MQLIRIKISNWRAVKSREIVLGAGVNIVEGANEAGKSSFIEALNHLFKERDSTKKKEVKGVTPKGHDIGSTVEVELKTGDYHFTYSKTYNRRPATSLSVFKPEPAQFTGLQAHEEALRILDETIDLALWQAIQLEQGSEFSSINLRASTGLARALDSAAGGTGVGEADSAILERAHSEYLRYYTGRTGKETGELASLRQQCDELSEEIAQASGAMQSMQAQVERSAMLTESIHEQKAALPELQSAFAALQTKQVEVDALLQQRRTIKAEVDAQSLRVNECERKRADRQQQQQQLSGRIEALAKLSEQHKNLLKTSVELAEKITGCEQQREKLKGTRAALQQSVADLEVAMKFSADAGELKTLESCFQQREKLQKELDECVAECKTYSVDDNALETMQQLQRQHRELEVRLTAQRPELVVHAVQAENFNGEEVAAGTQHKLDTSAALEFDIGSSARIVFTPATDLAALSDELAQVSTQLNNTLQRSGVSDVKAAVASHRKRLELQQKINSLRQRVDESLDTDVTTATNRLQVLRAAVKQPKVAFDHSELQPKLASARGSLVDIEREQRQFAADAESLQTDKARTDAQEELIKQQINDEQSELSKLRLQLESLRAELTDEDIAAQLKREQATLAELNKKLSEADETLANSNAEQLAQQVGNARQALDRAGQQFHHDEKELAAVSAQLDQLRSEGLHEKLEQLHATSSDAHERLSQVLRSAGAAKTLWECLSKHQHATRLSYVKPLSERVCRMGQIVFGADFQVQLNESLAIESRTLNGLTVPFDDLSGGAREQLGILLRLAATQLVAGVPLILDDTLGHTDATRLQTIGALLSNAGRHSQIIVMTCYPQRYRHVGDAVQHRLLPETAPATGISIAAADP